MFTLGDDHVESLIFWGSKIEVSGECRGEIHRWLALGRTAMSGLIKIWKYKDVMKQAERMMVNDLGFPVAMHGYAIESEKERKKIDSFKMLCWRLM